MSGSLHASSNGSREWQKGWTVGRTDEWMNNCHQHHHHHHHLWFSFLCCLVYVVCLSCQSLDWECNIYFSVCVLIESFLVIGVVSFFIMGYSVIYIFSNLVWQRKYILLFSDFLIYLFFDTFITRVLSSICTK